MTEYRVLGTIIEFTSATDIGFTLTFTGTGSATINSGTLAYLQIPANTKWRLPDLLQYLDKRMTDWIASAVAVGGDPAGTPTTTLSISFTPSLTSNGSLCALSINVTGLTVGGGAATITAATLVNTNGLWSKLGLCLESATTRNGSVAGGTATWSGLFQPRSIFCFLRSEIDEGNSAEVLQYKALKLSDGTGSVFYSGRHLIRRSLTLVDLDEEVAGRDVPLARVSALNADRVTVETNFTTENDYATSITGAQYQVDLVTDADTDGAFVSLGEVWVGRVTDRATGTEPQLIVLAEKVPSSITLPTGCVVTRISDVHALWFEAVRTGYLCVFDAVETPGADFGNVRWLSQEYMLAEDSKQWIPQRRDAGAPIYSYTFSLLRRDANDLSFAS